jgi:predicted enzyme related to lactoylglutathione lyase
MTTLYPIITTPALKECRDFYQRAFDATVLFENEWYVHLRVHEWEVGFLRPNPPKRLPVFQHASLTRGVCFGLEVEDLASVYEQLKQRGYEPLTRPEQFPSGDIAFSIVDPAGVVINVVERLPEKSDVIKL